MKNEIAIISLFFVCLMMSFKIAAFAKEMPAVGEMAPEFSLEDQNGKIQSLSSFRGKWVVLAFYPADFTSGCTLEAHTISSRIKDFDALNAVPLGISVQDSKSHKSFCTKEGINYTLLADSKKAVARQYGVLNFIGYAKRVTFIVDKNGKISYIDRDVQSHIIESVSTWIDWIKAHQ